MADMGTDSAPGCIGMRVALLLAPTSEIAGGNCTLDGDRIGLLYCPSVPVECRPLPISAVVLDCVASKGDMMVFGVLANVFCVGVFSCIIGDSDFRGCGKEGADELPLGAERFGVELVDASAALSFLFPSTRDSNSPRHSTVTQ
jgi:hypothetical protein